MAEKGESKMTWTQITNPAEYDGQHRTNELTIGFDFLRLAIGEPFYSGKPGYPDDDYKTDVCWAFKHNDAEQIVIWNYKNGPNYCGSEVSGLSDIHHFSAYASSPEAWDTFLDQFNLKTKAA